MEENGRRYRKSSRVSRKRREETFRRFVRDFTGEDSIGGCVTVEEEESDTGREFSMRLTPPTLALPFAEDNAGPVLCTLFSACRKRDKGEPGRNPPSLLSRFQISGYDLSRWIDYLELRYFHIPVVDFASALAVPSPLRAKERLGY